MICSGPAESRENTVSHLETKKTVGKIFKGNPKRSAKNEESIDSREHTSFYTESRITSPQHIFCKTFSLKGNPSKETLHSKKDYRASTKRSSYLYNKMSEALIDENLLKETDLLKLLDDSLRNIKQLPGPTHYDVHDHCSSKFSSNHGSAFSLSSRFRPPQSFVSPGPASYALSSSLLKSPVSLSSSNMPPVFGSGSKRFANPPSFKEVVFFLPIFPFFCCPFCLPFFANAHFYCRSSMLQECARAWLLQYADQKEKILGQKENHHSRIQ